MYIKKAVEFYEKGRIQQKDGRFIAAEKSYRKALSIDPSFAEVNNNLGNILLASQEYEKAEDCFKKALKAFPDNPMVLSNFGYALQKQGKSEQAINNLMKAIAISPDYVDAHVNLGIAHRDLDQLDRALECFDKAINLKPSHAAAHINKAGTLVALNRLEIAVTCLEKAIKLSPNSIQAYSLVGEILVKQGRLQEAKNLYERAIKIAPTFAFFHIGLAMTYFLLGEPDKALASTEQAAKINPDTPGLKTLEGEIFTALGKTEDAIRSFENAIQQDRNNYAAIFGLSRLKLFEEKDTEIISELEKRFQQEKTPNTGRIFLGFSLAKAYEDINQLDKSFSVLESANSLKKTALNYNFKDDHQLARSIIESFESSDTSYVETISQTNSKVIFIVGMPRSGTTLVEQVISSHSEVHGAGELDTFRYAVENVFPNIASRFGNGETLAFSKTHFQQIREFYEEYLSSLGKTEKIYTDKMPLNFRWVGFILNAFPNARIIHCVRNPIAVCWSIYKQNFLGDGNKFSYDLSDIVKYYRTYDEIMTYWDEKFPNQVFKLNYEYFTENQESVSKSLIEFCGLGWDEACLRFYENSRMIRTASSIQVRNALYSGSSEEWKKFKTQLSLLTDEFPEYV